jgi:hypothetical protein
MFDAVVMETIELLEERAAMLRTQIDTVSLRLVVVRCRDRGARHYGDWESSEHPAPSADSRGA